MFVAVEIHYDTADDNYHNPSKDNKTGVYEEHKFGYRVPTGRVERLVDIYKDKGENRCQYYQFYNIGLLVYVFWYVHLRNANITKFIYPIY